MLEKCSRTKEKVCSSSTSLPCTGKVSQIVLYWLIHCNAFVHLYTLENKHILTLFKLPMPANYQDGLFLCGGVFLCWMLMWDQFVTPVFFAPKRSCVKQYSLCSLILSLQVHPCHTVLRISWILIHLIMICIHQHGIHECKKNYGACFPEINSVRFISNIQNCILVGPIDMQGLHLTI